MSESRCDTTCGEGNRCAHSESCGNGGVGDCPAVAALRTQVEKLENQNSALRSRVSTAEKRAVRAEAAFEEQAVQLRAEESASAKLKNHMAALEEVLGRVAKYPHDATRWLEDVEAALRGAEAK